MEAPPAPPKRKPFEGVPRWVMVVVAVLAVAGIWTAVDAVNKKDKTPSTPGAGTELCALMRDPSNDDLGASDLRRLAGWNQTQLERYVRDRCPDLLWRVGG